MWGSSFVKGNQQTSTESGFSLDSQTNTESCPAPLVLSQPQLRDPSVAKAPKIHSRIETLWYVSPDRRPTLATNSKSTLARTKTAKSIRPKRAQNPRAPMRVFCVLFCVFFFFGAPQLQHQHVFEVHVQQALKEIALLSGVQAGVPHRHLENGAMQPVDTSLNGPLLSAFPLSRLFLWWGKYRKHGKKRRPLRGPGWLKRCSNNLLVGCRASSCWLNHFGPTNPKEGTHTARANSSPA